LRSRPAAIISGHAPKKRAVVGKTPATGYALRCRVPDDSHLDCRATRIVIVSAQTGVLADDAAVLTQFDPIGIGADLDGPADRARRNRVLVVAEADQAGLLHRGRQ